MLEDFELISPEDFAALPDDPDKKFVEIERRCRASMNNLINHQTRGDFDNMIRMQYIAIVSHAAEELGVPGLSNLFDDSMDHAQISHFMLRAQGAVTRMLIRGSGSASPHSVRLAARTRGRIELQIQRLRTIITESDLPTTKQQSLLNKLDELVTELNKPRVSFAAIGAILSFVAVGVASGTSFLADAPAALTTIHSLLGSDKEAEEAEQRRLGPSPAPKALPAPKPQRIASTGSFGGQWDDDVPF